MESLRVFAAWGLSLAIALRTLPYLMELAVRWRWVDPPGGRKIHDHPVPLAGGWALFLAAVPVAWLLAPAPPVATLPAAAAGVPGAPGQMVPVNPIPGWLVPAAMTLAFLVGLLDDYAKVRRRDLPAAIKIAGQAVPAILLIAGGVEMNYIRSPLGGLLMLPQWLDLPLTFCWLVGVTNAVNFIDGLDGLAGGVVGVAAFTLTMVALSLHQTAVAVWVAALLGACMGFLRYNFPPARVFMGDAGSNFLGFALAAISLTGYFKTATVAGLVVPLFALSLPVLNTVFVVLRRVSKGRSLVQALTVADREHSFDVLKRRGGFNTTETVLIFLLIAMALSAAGMGIAMGK